MRITISILLSILALPLFFIGNILGILASEIYRIMMSRPTTESWIPFYSYFSDFMFIVFITILSGLIAGGFSHFLIFKIYKNPHLITLMILPSFLTLMLCLNTLFPVYFMSIEMPWMYRIINLGTFIITYVVFYTLSKEDLEQNEPYDD
ncbi:hypothetical protein OAL90_01570 [Hyphomicrobiales bacterium]|nr:hypothetical protein [Hyphomicrobiales bacterium]